MASGHDRSIGPAGLKKMLDANKMFVLQHIRVGSVVWPRRDFDEKRRRRGGWKGEEKEETQ